MKRPRDIVEQGEQDRPAINMENYDIRVRHSSGNGFVQRATNNWNAARNGSKRIKTTDLARRNQDRTLARARNMKLKLLAEVVRAEREFQNSGHERISAARLLNEKREDLLRCNVRICMLARGITPTDAPSRKFTCRVFRLSGSTVELQGCGATTLVGEILLRVAWESQHLLPGARSENVKLVLGLFVLGVEESYQSFQDLGIGQHTILNIVSVSYTHLTLPTIYSV